MTRHGIATNGTLIDVYDDIGIQAMETAPNDLRFEAGWTPDGAVCVSHLRKPALPDPRKDGACPWLADRTGGPACTEDWARRHGALLFNRSR